MKQKSTAIALVLLAFFAYHAHGQYRINCGGAQVASGVDTFYTDNYFSAGTAVFTTDSAITGTSIPQIYKSERYSSNRTFSYAIPVSPGQYKVTLHFAEIYLTASGLRVFDVSIEGLRVLDNLDIFNKAGGRYKAIKDSFDVTVADDTLNIYFSSLTADGGVNNPKISAIEVRSLNPVNSSASWSTNGSSIFSNNTGNVGIGTSNPQAKLAVKGDILAQKVKVSIASNLWPDYVFKEGYPLASLKEVEDFIRRKGHLPGVPAASEVAHKGLDIADGQTVLLKKIEELTLYLIAQEKQLEDQRRRLKVLQQEVHRLQKRRK